MTQSYMSLIIIIMSVLVFTEASFPSCLTMTSDKWCENKRIAEFCKVSEYCGRYWWSKRITNETAFGTVQYTAPEEKSKQFHFPGMIIYEPPQH